MLSSQDIRALAERLVGIPSVSPDPVGETACARALAAALPAGLESGEWRTPDGRPVVWAMLRGRSPRTVVLLGHYDTVGVAEYATLGSAERERIAFDPAALLSRLLERARSVRATLPARLLEDLNEESEHPGTWAFGRGALDMKSALAAAIGALGALADARESLEGSVLFVATPDEEYESQGMIAAVPELLRLREDRRLEYLGALNLDYCLEPVVYLGVVGKLQLGCLVLGDGGHVSDPSRGADAIQLATAIASRLNGAADLADTGKGESGVPPAVLTLRDLKAGYSIQAATEALIELNVITFSRPVDRTLEVFRAAVAKAINGTAGARRPARVITHAQPSGAHGPENGTASGLDARAATLDRVRRVAREAGIEAPAAILYLVPPFYPAAAPGRGPLVRAAREVAAAEDLPLRPFYPFISDASYVSWRGEGDSELAHGFPALGHEYRLPVEAMRALDLDVVNLGPWGRDAHSIYERVHAPFAFERLPRLIERVVRRAFAASG